MRYVIGPGFGYQVGPATPAAPSAPAKTDPAVSVLGLDQAAQTVSLQIPAYDPATANTIGEVRAYLVPSGQPAPADGPGYVASVFPFTAGDVSAVQAGAEVALKLPSVPPGPYVGAVVIGYLS